MTPEAREELKTRIESVDLADYFELVCSLRDRETDTTETVERITGMHPCCQLPCTAITRCHGQGVRLYVQKPHPKCKPANCLESGRCTVTGSRFPFRASMAR